MTDRRLTPANERVAHTSLKDLIKDVAFVDGEVKTVTIPIADIRRKPDGALERQLIFGDSFRVLEPDSGAGYCFGQALDGDYVGYIKQSAIGPFVVASHVVCSMGAQVYPSPELKTLPLMTLPFGAELSILGAENGYCKLTGGGFVPLQQVAPLGANFPDYVDVAEYFLRVPYLWGGDSNQGLDCSALIHTSLRALGIGCPRDSDLQAASLGHEISETVDLQRGDFVFWKGHVGVMQDATTLIHANAHFMMVTSEPLETVTARSISAGDGGITVRRRLTDSAD